MTTWLLRTFGPGLLERGVWAAVGALVTHGLVTQTEATTLAGALLAMAKVAWLAWQRVRVAGRSIPDLPAVPSPPGTTADDLNRQEIARHGG